MMLWLHGNIIRGKARSGFLLVELLATMTISALLLAALFSIASLTTRMSGRIQRQSESIENGTLILAALSRDIERAAPIRWAGKDAGLVFNGAERSMVFARETKFADGGTNLNAIQIDGDRGFIRRAPDIPPQAISFSDLAFEQPAAIWSDGYVVTFAYYGRLPDGREVLTTAWENASQLPVAVRLTLWRADKTRSTLRVKLDTDAEPGCGFPEKGSCSLRPGAKPSDRADVVRPDKSGEGG
ncbi:prepilin-type N-terminal cleavage/methylation domain-containing protein (plasmid) [Rhizobium sp. TH2]|uniref:PulJ/GspJ family protein n=1 Tax=Rhizobium sp. TH2 TaxID=2775403 RepID=UPI002157538F|nr:prepilin-type N-terminal cleavage/methylation domain-containing protein [Rhizobium sp. TH2]UVC12608.1 prepilin-type N-terminal cleavage/methylation domain-containing protein [Rhizobium sp. TH2]